MKSESESNPESDTERMRLQPIHTHQHNKMQIQSNTELQVASIPPTTQPTFPVNHYLINLHVMSHTMKLLKLSCFSADSR